MSQPYNSKGIPLLSIYSGTGGDGYNILAVPGTTLPSSATVILSNANGVSWGIDGSTITASVGAGTGGMITHDSAYHSGNIMPGTDQYMGGALLGIGTRAVPGSSAGSVLLYAFDQNGKTRLGMITPDGTQITHAQDAFIICRNTSGSTIDKGKAVYVTGSTGQTPNISPAKADALSTMPAIGITSDSIGINAFGRVQISGVADQLDTSSFSEGDRLWVSDSVAGDLTVTEPTYPSLRQRLCIVVNSHATQGKLLVLNTGARGEFGIQAVSAGTSQATSGGIVFSNSNGISFGLNGQTVTGSHNALTTAALSNHSHGFSAANGSATFQTLSFIDSNGVSWSSAPGGQLWATVNTNYVGLNTAQTNVVWTVNTSGISLNAAGYAGTTTAATNASLTLDSNGLRVSVAAPGGGAAQTVSAGTTSQAANPLYLSNSNGVSFGFLGGASTSVITASHNALTTARASNDAVGLNTAQTNVTWTVNSSGISIDAGKYAGTVTGITGGIGLTANTSGVSVSIPAYLTTAAQSAGSVYASSNTFGTSSGTYDQRSLSIAGSGWASIAASNSGWVVSVPVGLTTAAQSVGSVYASSNTFGTSSGTYDQRSLSIAGSGWASVAASNSGWVVSVPVGLTTAALSTGNLYAVSNTTQSTSITFDQRSLSFAGAGNASVGVSNGSVLISVTGGGAAGTQSLGMSTQTQGGATAGTSGYATGTQIQYLLVPGSNITMSQSVNGASGTMSIFGPSPSGGAGPAVGVSTMGDTLGNTGTWSSGTYYLAGSNSMTLSQSTAAGAATLWMLPPVSQLTAGTNITLSTAGSTITIIGADAPGAYTAMTFQPRQLGASTTLVNTNTSQVWIVPFRLPAYLSASTLMFMESHSGTITSAATAQRGETRSLAIYSQHSTNASRFETLWTASRAWTQWNSGTSSCSFNYGGTTSSSAGSNLLTASFMGPRIHNFDIGSVMPPGLYLYAVCWSSSSAGYSAAGSRNAMYYDNPLSAAMGTINQALNNSLGYADAGTYSAGTAVLPGTIFLSEIRVVANQVPFFKIGAL